MSPLLVYLISWIKKPYIYFNFSIKNVLFLHLQCDYVCYFRKKTKVWSGDQVVWRPRFWRRGWRWWIGDGKPIFDLPHGIFLSLTQMNRSECVFWTFNHGMLSSLIQVIFSSTLQLRLWTSKNYIAFRKTIQPVKALHLVSVCKVLVQTTNS